MLNLIAVKLVQEKALQSYHAMYPQCSPLLKLQWCSFFNFRKCLKSKYAESEREYSNVTQALKAYESVGMGFDSLVNEYSRLRNEVENKQWALSEFQQSLEHTDR